MKKYKCHKVVSALKIESLITTDERKILTAVGSDFRIGLSPGFLEKHNPEVGGYIVEYEDGYLSFSPAEAFEAGYQEIKGAEYDSTTLSLLHQARAALLEQQELNASRALSVAITQIETAQMWFDKHRSESAKPNDVATE